MLHKLCVGISHCQTRPAQPAHTRQVQVLSKNYTSKEVKLSTKHLERTKGEMLRDPAAVMASSKVRIGVWQQQQVAKSEEKSKVCDACCCCCCDAVHDT